MIDTNVIYSAIFFPDSNIAKMVEYIKSNHVLVLSKYIINEVDDVLINKCKDNYLEIKCSLNNLIDQVIDVKGIDSTKYPTIRDIDDLPVLAAAIILKVDILITGDKDFDDVVVDKPRILKPRQFQDEYMK